MNMSGNNENKGNKMTKEELTQVEDILISMVQQSTRLLRECKSALNDYDRERVVFISNIVDRFGLMSHHVERLKPYLIEEDENDE